MTATPLSENTALIPTFTTRDHDLGDFRLDRHQDPATNRTKYVLSVNDQPVAHSPRFIDSVFGLLGQSRSVLKIMDMHEVVGRSLERKVLKGTKVRTTYDADGVALGTVNRSKYVIDVADVVKAVDGLGARFGYNGDGAMVVETKPALESTFKVVGDDFRITNGFVVPVDGFGSLTHYASMLRLVCTNGAMAMARAFSTTCSVGKKTDPWFAMEKFLRNVGNVEVETHLADRMRCAADTVASADEVYLLSNLITGDGKTNRDRLFQNAFSEELAITAADLAQFDSKKRSRIASRVTVYDLINMATEAATHYGRHRAQAFTGTVLSRREFDLEGVDHSYLGSARDGNRRFWLEGVLSPN